MGIISTVGGHFFKRLTRESSKRIGKAFYYQDIHKLWGSDDDEPQTILHSPQIPKERMDELNRKYDDVLSTKKAYLLAEKYSTPSGEDIEEKIDCLIAYYAIDKGIKGINDRDISAYILMQSIALMYGGDLYSLDIKNDIVKILSCTNHVNLDKELRDFEYFTTIGSFFRDLYHESNSKESSDG